MTASCVHCGAPLRLQGVTKRQVECDYCHNHTILNDQVWAAVKPKTQVHQVQAPRVVIDMSNVPGAKTASRIGTFVGITVLLSVIAGIALPIYLQHQAQKRVNQALANSGIKPREKPKAPPTAAPKPKKDVTIVISSYPEGAKVSLMGRAVGVTPYTLVKQESPDTLIVKLTKDGFEPKIVKVVLNEDQNLKIELPKKK